MYGHLDHSRGGPWKIHSGSWFLFGSAVSTAFETLFIGIYRDMAWSRSSIQLTSLWSQRRCLNKMPVCNKRSTHLSEVWSCYTPSLGLQWTKRSPLCLRLDSHLGSMLPECQPRQLWSYKYIPRRMRQLRGLGVLVSFSGRWISTEDMLGESGRCINGTFRSNLRQQRSTPCVIPCIGW